MMFIAPKLYTMCEIHIAWFDDGRKRTVLKLLLLIVDHSC